MKFLREIIKLSTAGGRPSFHQITGQVQEIVDRSGVKNGVCVVNTSHTTCSIITQEFSHDITYAGLEFIQQDFIDVLEKIIPTCRKEGQYMAPGTLLTEFSNSIGEDNWQTLNIDGHLRSALIGRSESFGIVEGKIDMGSFGQIYFIDFDQTHPRERKAAVQIIGE